jgi:hypothetical protein
MPLGQPLIDRRRHQKIGVAIDEPEVAHARDVRRQGQANQRPDSIGRFRVKSDRLLGGRDPNKCGASLWRQSGSRGAYFYCW